MLHCFLSDIRNGECFAGACLAVSKKRNNALLEECGEERFDLELVNMCRGFLVPVSIVKHELMVLDIFGDPINFYFRLMYLNTRVKTAYCVDLAQNDLLFEQWSFTHADTNVHLIRTDMLQGSTYQ